MAHVLRFTYLKGLEILGVGAAEAAGASAAAGRFRVWALSTCSEETSHAHVKLVRPTLLKNQLQHENF